MLYSVFPPSIGCRSRTNSGVAPRMLARTHRDAGRHTLAARDGADRRPVIDQEVRAAVERGGVRQREVASRPPLRGMVERDQRFRRQRRGAVHLERQRGPAGGGRGPAAWAPCLP